MKEETSKAGENVLIILKGESDTQLQYKLRSQDEKFHKTLLFSTIFANWSYLGLMVMIVRCYINFHGKHVVALISILLCIYLVISVVSYMVWKTAAIKRRHSYLTYQGYLVRQLSKLSAQLRLAVLYLIGYTSLLAAALFFFDIEIKPGLFHLLRLTAPAVFVTYVFGLYIIINLWKQLKKLKVVLMQNTGLLMDKINQN